MSTITLVEQTTPSVPAAGQQIVYPKVGSLARLDATGVEKTLLDSRTVALPAPLLDLVLNLTGGL